MKTIGYSSLKLIKLRFIDFDTICKQIVFIVLLLGSRTIFAQSITINSINYKQTIDMMGGDMERSSKAIQSADNKNEIIDWGFKDIAFNYCRVQYDKNQELVEGTKTWSFYDKQVATMKQIKIANPNIKFFGTLRSDYDGYGTENNMPDWIVDFTNNKVVTDKYAIFLADYLEYMNQQGVPIHTLSISKEWTTFVYASRATKIIAKLKTECTARNIPQPMISDQGFWSISQGINYINDVTTLGTKDQYDSFCSHDYQNEGDTKWATIVAKAAALGKKVYDDETSTGAGAATSGVEPAMSKPIGVYIEKAIAYEAGLSGEIFFEIWSRGINTETRSIYFPSSGTGARLRGYYIMKQFANNVLDSKYITTTSSSLTNVYTITFRKGNKVVLWVINKGTTAYPALPISLDASKLNGSIAANYWSNTTPIIGSTATYTGSGDSFSPSIEGESMNCFVFNVLDNTDPCAGNALPTINITSSTYSAVAPASVTITANVTDADGTISKVDFYQGTTLIKSDITSPFSAVASGLTAGSYSFTAKVTDDCKAVTTSTAIDICVNALNKMEAECYNDMLGIQTEACTEGTENVGWINNGDWILYSNINLTGMKSIIARMAGKTNGSTIEVRTGSITGTLLATLAVPNTGGAQVWKSDSVNLATVTGTQNVYLVFKGTGTGYLFNVNWFGFSANAKVVTEIEEANLSETVRVYPNPFTDMVHIDLNGNAASKVDVFNLFGQLVSTQIITESKLEIDLSTLNSGLYFIKLATDNHVITRTILKK